MHGGHTEGRNLTKLPRVTCAQYLHYFIIRLFAFTSPISRVHGGSADQGSYNREYNICDREKIMRLARTLFHGVSALFQSYLRIFPNMSKHSRSKFVLFRAQKCQNEWPKRSTGSSERAAFPPRAFRSHRQKQRGYFE